MRATYDGRKVAVKKIPISDNDEIDSAKREVFMLQKLYPCPHIIEIQGVVTSATSFSLVMDLAYDSLFGIISRAQHTPPSWSIKLKMMRDISAGIGFIHAAGVVHGDLSIAIVY